MTPGGAGNANTGSGGGGGGQVPGHFGTGGNGGSGLVIIRYSDKKALATATTGNPAYTKAGGYHIYKFTGTGSITL
jgi:hypothetical protein